MNSVAESVENMVVKQEVAGSNPVQIANYFWILISELVFIKWTIRLLPMYEKMQTLTEYEWSDN